MMRTSSISEKPRSYRPRKLVDWLNPTGEKKVHSLVDKVYKKKNLEIAWKKVKQNKGCGGIDSQNLEEFEANLDQNLEKLHQELRENTYQPQIVLRHYIPKRGQPERKRPLGIPTIYDKVCQQALLNRLDPIFEPLFDEASFGYRRGRSTKDALKRVWCGIHQGNEWIVDADLKDFFGSADHEKLISLLQQKIADGRVLTLIENILKAGYFEAGKKYPTEQGVPQGGVISPLLSNILLTPFDREMRRKGYCVARFADDWVATCRTRQQAQEALRFATKVLEKLGVTLNKEKTRIVHIKQGFEFLGYKIKQGQRKLKLSKEKIKSRTRNGAIYAYPRQESLTHFKEQIRKQTRRKSPLNTKELINQLNPIIRGWGNYYAKAHVRKLFNQLDRWIVRRIRSQRLKRWRNGGWRILPESKLYGDLGLVSLIRLIPSLYPRYKM